MTDSDAMAGHVFLSYVREDAGQVDQLQETLEAAGIRVWRDTQDLWPGEDWKAKIRQAITDDALVFLACFSTRSLARAKTYQNEELVVAIDGLRQRRPDEPWLIPIRLDDCEVPDRDLGGGRMLSSLQRVDVFGERAERGVARLVATVVRLLGSTPISTSNATGLPLSTSRTEQVKAMLALPERDIALEDLVMTEADRCADALDDPSRFPTTSPAVTGDGTRFMVDQAHRYLEATLPLAELLITGCAYGSARHNPTWRRAVEAIGATIARPTSGQQLLLQLRHLALLPVLYGAGLGALARENWQALVAVTTAAQVRDRHGEKVSAVSYANVGLPFSSAELVAR